MTSTMKFTLTALLLTLAAIACTQRPSQAAPPAIVAPAASQPSGGMSAAERPQVLAPPTITEASGQPMRGMGEYGQPMVMGAPRAPDPMAVSNPALVKLTLDFTVTWDPSLNYMTTADVPQSIDKSLANMNNEHHLSVKVRHAQDSSAPAGSAPATLCADVHLEITMPRPDSQGVEGYLLDTLKGTLNECMTVQAKERRAALEDELKEAKAKFAELTGHDSDVNTLPYEIERLNDERASTDARVTALEQQIDRMQHQAEEKLKTDPMVQELTKIVELQEKALELLEKAQAQGAATASEIPPYRIKLAEARIALAQRKEAIGESGGQLAKFSGMLADLSVERTVLDKKIEAAKVKLTRCSEELMKPRADISWLSKEIEQAKGYRIEKVERKVEPLPAGSQPAVAPSGAGFGMGQ